jgi:DNA mismatch endonuclease (patch repair protein)
MTKSEQMARIRSRDTMPELIARRSLYQRGIRYRLQRRDLPGKPDIYVGRLRLAIFVHGCFWHGHDCPRGKRPATNKSFWDKKLTRNRERDEAVRSQLADRGIETLTIWSCGLGSIDDVAASISQRYKQA